MLGGSALGGFEARSAGGRRAYKYERSPVRFGTMSNRTFCLYLAFWFSGLLHFPFNRLHRMVWAPGS